MNKPQNFRKINGVTFANRNGKKYMFATNGVEPELWIFQQPDTTKYCIAFVFDWENNTYEIKKAGNGDGKNWVTILHQGNYTHKSMKTMNTFIDWVHFRVIQFENEYN